MPTGKRGTTDLLITERTPEPYFCFCAFPLVSYVAGGYFCSGTRDICRAVGTFWLCRQSITVCPRVNEYKLYVNVRLYKEENMSHSYFMPVMFTNDFTACSRSKLPGQQARLMVLLAAWLMAATVSSS